MNEPCSWVLDDIVCGCGCEDYPPAVQERAEQYASYILWAATGRRYGLCEQTVRPCGRSKGTAMPTWGWGALWSGGLWWPFIGADGLWRNCGCHGFCNCAPKCEAYLPGPVNSITEVLVDQQVVDPSTYEVQDNHWLVRINGGCWPENPDMAANEAFEVTYLKGEPVPPVLANAARTLACEFAKGCVGDQCRLPGRLQFIARQGVTAQMVDLDRLMDRGLTGLHEVDQIIAAMNPHAIKERPRVWSPDRPFPRTVTTPAAMVSS